MKFQDIKDALEHNGECSINDYIFTLTEKKDKIGRKLVYIDLKRVGVKVAGFDDEWTEFPGPGFRSFQQFRYFLAKNQLIED